MAHNTVLLETIQYVLWGKGNACVNDDVYTEMKDHTIASLPAPILSKLDMSSELYDSWHKYILKQMAYYCQYKHNQESIPLTVPYVILKGTTAAQYYPYPEYRMMGDIDIVTRHEDFDQANDELLKDGYKKVKELPREVSYIKNGIVVELHRFFASLNNPTQARYMDDLLIDNINASHILPDPINGLVLLEHINQHLENGIGLRQIIDWMMFVDKCLPDDKWPEFKILSENIGLKKLAITTTRMCEKYLGLPQRKWCAEANDSLCDKLMDYVMSSGNFGNKRITDSDISENVLAYASTPKMAFKLLQEQGLKNWRAVHKHKALKPFAWIYQAIRYIRKGLNREQATTRLKKEYEAAKQRNALFHALGVKTAAKGIVVYKDGKYVKK